MVLGVTGSIACYQACDLVNRLRAVGVDVTVVMTAGATKFVTPGTFEALSGHGVVTDLFAPARELSPIHTTLARAASVVVICPATANVIGKLANGICDDLLTCLVTATTAPVLIAPAMNEQMYRSPAVRANLATLKRRGYQFLGPVAGHLVCEIEGIGHVAPVPDVVRAVQRVLG